MSQGQDGMSHEEQASMTVTNPLKKGTVKNTWSSSQEAEKTR